MAAVSHARQPELDLIALRGDVDLSNVDELLDQLTSLIRAGRPVVLDLTDVSYLDSAGLRLLDDVLRHADRSGSPLRLVAAPGSACRQLITLASPELTRRLAPPA